MSTVVDSRKERIYCLESALKYDPENYSARRGLVLLGALNPGDDVTPVPPIRRKWMDELGSEEEPPKNFVMKIWTNPILRIITFAGGGIILISLIFLGVFSASRNRSTPIIRVSITPRPTITYTPTLTVAPTKTLAVKLPTPTPGITPLWMLLEATYTPVPVYVNTPHPILEAYRVAMRAYEQNDPQRMLTYIQQALDSDSTSVDLHYYAGEAHRLLGDYEEAIDSYEAALEINSIFAPAYLGRARATLGINSNANVENDLRRALEYDPYMVDAYLERAKYYLRDDNPEAALDDLLVVEGLFPESPQLYVLRAQTYLLLDENATALEDAKLAYELDITSLPVYLVLAQAYLANQNPTQALNHIELYNRYEPLDANGWLVTGMAHYQLGRDYEAALEAFDKAIDLDENITGAYWYRGLIYLSLENPQEAVNDLVIAVRLAPSSFETNRDLGIALYEAERWSTAYRQFNSTETFAGRWKFIRR
jgi:tetratricopeptide (TPR) repeat protein